MTTPVVIQAVPWDARRSVRAIRLAEETGGIIVWDQSHSAWETWLRVLEAMESGPAIVLEDDVRLCDDWRERIEESIAERPDSVIRFFSQGGPGGWRPGSAYYCNPCSYLPRGAAESLLEWIRSHDTTHLHDLHDHSVGEWLHSRGEDYWTHVPSLVQHESLPSLIDPHRPLHRESPTFKQSREGS